MKNGREKQVRARWLVTSDFAHSELARRMSPDWLKRAVKSRIPYAEFRSEQCRREAEARFAGHIPAQSDYASPYPIVLGVITDTSYYFAYHVAACRELGVAYRLIDISVSDWIEAVRKSGCNAFLASPSTLLSSLRHMFDERLRVLTEDLRRPLFPSYPELWLWESKRRMRDWLVAHNVPHPRTEVFYDRDHALAFARTSAYPVVCKTDVGAAASGVFILRNRAAAEGMIKKAFGPGIVPRNWDRRDRQQGYILFQEYVPHDSEWRIVRIGDDFLGRRKSRVGDYASGSGELEWLRPSKEMLDFAKMVTDLGSFCSMAVDFFAVSDSPGRDRFLVNELQCLIGAKALSPNDQMGRSYLEGSEWRFEPGDFYRNACANLRIAFVLKEMGRRRSGDAA